MKKTRGKEWAYRRAILLEEVSHGILELMRASDVSKKELARRLGCRPPFITKVLSGEHNLQLETLSDICFALDRAVHISFGATSEGLRIPRDTADFGGETKLRLVLGANEPSFVAGPSAADESESLSLTRRQG